MTDFNDFIANPQTVSEFKEEMLGAFKQKRQLGLIPCLSGDGNLNDVTQFADEIESWVIDAFKAIGCDTAKSVLELTSEDLSKRTDLEEETVSSVLKVLKEEFED